MAEWWIETPQFFSIFSVIFWFRSIGKKERNIYCLLRNVEISQQNSKLRKNFEQRGKKGTFVTLVISLAL